MTGSSCGSLVSLDALNPLVSLLSGEVAAGGVYAACKVDLEASVRQEVDGGDSCAVGPILARIARGALRSRVALWPGASLRSFRPGKVAFLYPGAASPLPVYAGAGVEEAVVDVWTAWEGRVERPTSTIQAVCTVRSCWTSAAIATTRRAVRTVF